MKVNYVEVIECGDKLYKLINPNTTMDVPSYFYMKLEKKWLDWKQSKSELSFCEYCKFEITK